MQAMCCRQWPRRIRYQPAEMKIVLTKFNEALMAGRSVIFKRQNVQRPTSNVQRSIPEGRFDGDSSDRTEPYRTSPVETLDVARWTLDVSPCLPFWNPLHPHSRANSTG